jgi:hypothetical protein
LIAVAIGKAPGIPFHADIGGVVINALWKWPEFAHEVGTVTTQEVLRGNLAHSEIREWARSLVRIAAVAQREAWIYEYHRRQQSTETVPNSLRSVMTTEEYDQVDKLLWEAHEESIDVLQRQGDSLQNDRSQKRRPRGRPSRPALKAVLRLLVKMRIREQKARKASPAKLRALLTVLPIVGKVCNDLGDECRQNPAALAMRLRNYL